MKRNERGLFSRIAAVLSAAALVTLIAVPAVAGGYDSALKDVKGIKAVFEVTQESPKTSNVIFWAVKDMYRDETVRALPEAPQVVIVFHGPAVKLISTDRTGFKESDYEELDKFADTIRELKKDGVKMEICLYAAKVMGVDPKTIMPEIDHVGNGFVSVAGYQAQGYAVIRVP